MHAAGRVDHGPRPARRVIAAADASKFTRTALGVVCPLERVDVIVTDHNVQDETVAAISALGVVVRRA
jgi:DeoR/GlpR family transcriptional regulator of sugar metabolism